MFFVFVCLTLCSCRSNNRQESDLNFFHFNSRNPKCFEYSNGYKKPDLSEDFYFFLDLLEIDISDFSTNFKDNQWYSIGGRNLCFRSKLSSVRVRIDLESFDILLGLAHLRVTSKKALLLKPEVNIFDMQSFSSIIYHEEKPELILALAAFTSLEKLNSLNSRAKSTFKKATEWIEHVAEGDFEKIDSDLKLSGLGRKAIKSFFRTNLIIENETI